MGLYCVDSDDCQNGVQQGAYKLKGLTMKCQYIYRQMLDGDKLTCGYPEEHALHNVESINGFHKFVSGGDVEEFELGKATLDAASRLPVREEEPTLPIPSALFKPYAYRTLYEKRAKEPAGLIVSGHAPSIDKVARLLAKEDAGQ